MTKDKKIKVLILLIVMLLFATTTLFYEAINPFFIEMFSEKFNVVSSKNNLAVHFISVGQGDAIAITFPDDYVLLIDSGPTSSAISYADYIKNKVLGNKTNKKIDCLLLTHADMDHCGGVNKLLELFEIENVLLPKVESETQSYQATLNNIKAKTKYEVIETNYSFEKSDCKLTCFGPLDEEKTNDSCPLIKLEFMNKSFLFTGDLSVEMENEFIDEYGTILDSDVLKVGHHGSATSTGEAFLNTVTPEYSVISVGQNIHGHPSEEVVARLNNSGSTVYRTDEVGSVMFLVGENYNLKVCDEDCYITSLSLNYLYIIVIFEITGVVILACIIYKKKKTK